jgi:hypothetical protein
MKSNFLGVAGVALTMYLGLAAGAANATIVPITSWTTTASGGSSAIFGNNGVDSVFNDSFNFSLPAGSSGNGSANAISLSANGQVTFTAFTLYENSIGLISGGTGGTTSYLSFTGGAVPGAYTLNVAGKKTYADKAGSYSGNIVTTAPCNVSPVPEPQTYAMMLAGLGLLGFSARRRMNNNA